MGRETGKLSYVGIALVILIALVAACAKPAPPPAPTPAPVPTAAPTAPAPTTAPSTPKPSTPTTVAPTTAVPSVTAQKITWSLAHKDPPTHSTVVNVLQPMIDEINKRSNGRLEIKMYLSESLYKAAQLLDAVKTGGVDTAWVPTPYFGGTVPIWNLPMNPFLFYTYDHLVRGWDAGIKDIWIDQAAKLNTHLAGETFYFNGFNTLWSNKSIPKLPADIKGLKIRSFSSILDVFLKSAGAAPVNMSSTEMYLALQRGTIDGQIHSALGEVSFRLQEVVKYGSLVPVTPGAMDLFMVSQKAWQNLPPDLQKIFDETAFKYLTLWGKEKEPVTAKESLDIMIKAGVQVHTPTDQEIEAWKAISKPAWDKFIESTGEIGKKQIDIMMKVK